MATLHVTPPASDSPCGCSHRQRPSPPHLAPASPGHPSSSQWRWPHGAGSARSQTRCAELGRWISHPSCVLREDEVDFKFTSPTTAKDILVAKRPGPYPAGHTRDSQTNIGFPCSQRPCWTPHHTPPSPMAARCTGSERGWRMNACKWYSASKKQQQQQHRQCLRTPPILSACVTSNTRAKTKWSSS